MSKTELDTPGEITLEGYLVHPRWHYLHLAYGLVPAGLIIGEEIPIVVVELDFAGTYRVIGQDATGYELEYRGRV